MGVATILVEPCPCKYVGSVEKLLMSTEDLCVNFEPSFLEINYFLYIILLSISWWIIMNEIQACTHVLIYGDRIFVYGSKFLWGAAAIIDGVARIKSDCLCK